MMIRVPTLNFFSTQIETLNYQYQNMYKLNAELSTGQRYQHSSEDVAAATQATQLQISINQLKSYSTNTSLAKAKTANIESAVNSAISLVTKIKTEILSAQSDSMSAAQKKTIATQLQGSLAQLMNVANTKDSNGQFIFAGANSSNEAFVNQNGTYKYQGAQATLVSISPTDQVVQYENGYNVFGNMFAGNGTYTVTANSANTGTGYTSAGTVTSASSYIPDVYTVSFSMVSGQLSYSVSGASQGVVVPATTYTSGANIAFNGISVGFSGQPNVGDTFTIQPSQTQNIFNTIQNAINGLNASTANAAEQAQFYQSMNQASASMDQALGSLSNYISTVGVRAGIIDTVAMKNTQMADNQSAEYGTLTGTDIAQATSTLSQTMVALQATQLTYVKIQDVLTQLLQRTL